MIIAARAISPEALCPSCKQASQRLKSHPGVEVISRDRSTEDLRGASEGAPTAQQVIDRWHLLISNVLRRLDSIPAEWLQGEQ